MACPETLVAEQLTLIESQLFKAIPEIELFNFIKNNGKPTPHLTALVNWGRKIHNWIALIVVSAPDLKVRTELLRYFIKIAKHCHNIKNFNTLFEIVEALSVAPVQRLVKTWKNLPNKYKSNWLELLDVVSPQDNFVLYREVLRSNNENQLPSLSVYLTDLENATSRMQSQMSDGRINFLKFHAIGSVLISINYCQNHQCTYAFDPNDDLQDQLKSLQSFSLSDSLISLSRERELPKGFETASQVEPMFGISLVDCVEKFGVFGDRNRGMIPSVVRDLVKLLPEDRVAVEGIFRKAGNHNVIHQVRHDIDTTNSLNYLRDLSVHDAAGLLKLYFAELPDPLFTGALYKSYRAVSNLNTKEERIEALRLLFSLLPEAHRDTAYFFLKFLKRVSLNSKNLMNAKNLAVIFSPTLFGFGKANPQKFEEKINDAMKWSQSQQLEREIRRQAQIALCMELMIENIDEISSNFAKINIDYSRRDGKAGLPDDLQL